MVLQSTSGTVQALRITVAEAMHALFLRPLEHSGNGVDTLVEHINGRAERETNEVVAGGREEVAPVGRVDVEEDSVNTNALLLEELLEERLKGGMRKLAQCIMTKNRNERYD